MHEADGNVRIYLRRSEDAENEWFDICLKKGGILRALEWMSLQREWEDRREEGQDEVLGKNAFRRGRLRIITVAEEQKEEIGKLIQAGKKQDS